MSRRSGVSPLDGDGNDPNLLKARRERSANFSPREQWVFLELMERFGPIIQDRHNDLATNANKEAAWTHLTNTFNMRTGVTKRTEKSLKNLWRRVKLEAKRERKLGCSQMSGLEAVKTKAAAAAIAAGWKDDDIDEFGSTMSISDIIDTISPSSLVEVVTDMSPPHIPNQAYPHPTLTSPYHPSVASLASHLTSPINHSHNSFLLNLVKLYQQQDCEINAVPDLIERLSNEVIKDVVDRENDDNTTMVDTNAIVETTEITSEEIEQLDTPKRKCKTNVYYHGYDKEPVDDDGNIDQARDTQTTTNSVRGNGGSGIGSLAPGMSGPYLLKKETHCSTILDQLMRDDTFTDVTLTADGQSIRAHRVVLSLASMYFRQVLSKDSNVQSIVLLRDVKFAELRNIINFIYTGEATVDASELESFMRTAELLEISSLCEGHKSLSSRVQAAAAATSESSPEKSSANKRPRRESNTSPSKSRKVGGAGNSNSMASIKQEPVGDGNATIADGGVRTNETEDGGDIEDGDADVEADGDAEMDGDIDGDCEAGTSDGEGGGGVGGRERGIRNHHGGTMLPNDREDFLQPCLSGASSPSVCGEEFSNEQGTPPGRCPFCPQSNHIHEGVAMMEHLLETHATKPAFPCKICWRVFTKRSHFMNHQQTCHNHDQMNQLHMAQ